MPVHVTCVCRHEAIDKYKRMLEADGCDLVVPLCHTYVPFDKTTCERFDVPLILSGHDHHVVDEVHHGTRLIKPGMDARYVAISSQRAVAPAPSPELAHTEDTCACHSSGTPVAAVLPTPRLPNATRSLRCHREAAIIDITWPNASATKPDINVRFTTVKEWKRHPVLERRRRETEAVLRHLCVRCRRLCPWVPMPPLLLSCRPVPSPCKTSCQPCALPHTRFQHRHTAVSYPR